MKARAFFSASALAIAAIGLATPTIAAAEDPPSRGQGRHGDWSGRADNGGNGGARAENRGGWRQNEGDAQRARPWQAPAAAPAPAPAPAPPPRATHSEWGQAQARIAQERARADAQRNNTTDAQRRGTWTGRDSNQTRSGSWDRDRDRTGDRDRDRDGRNDGWQRGDHDRNGSWNRGDNRWSGSDRDRYRDRDYRHDDRRSWDRNDWRRNDRYDWRRYRDSHRSIYRIGRYYAPYHGYAYRRIGIGFTLGSLFYGNRYWIDDPWSYRLPEVYGPYRWVRYYDDVLLVDVYTGEVVDVIYDFFW